MQFFFGYIETKIEPTEYFNDPMILFPGDEKVRNGNKINNDRRESGYNRNRNRDPGDDQEEKEMDDKNWRISPSNNGNQCRARNDEIK